MNLVLNHNYENGSNDDEFRYFTLLSLEVPSGTVFHLICIINLYSFVNMKNGGFFHIFFFTVFYYQILFFMQHQAVKYYLKKSKNVRNTLLIKSKSMQKEKTNDSKRLLLHVCHLSKLNVYLTEF